MREAGRGVRRVRAQAATEYVLATLVVLAGIAGVMRFSGGVSRAYKGGAAALGSGRPTPGDDVTLRVPGALRVETTAGEGTLTFLRRTPSGWVTVPAGGVISDDMEFAVEVVLRDGAAPATAEAFIEWQGHGSPRGLTSVVVGDRSGDRGGDGADGGRRPGVRVDVERVSDGLYRSGPLRLSDCLARIR